MDNAYCSDPCGNAKNSMTIVHALALGIMN